MAATGVRAHLPMTFVRRVAVVSQGRRRPQALESEVAQAHWPPVTASLAVRPSAFTLT